jgi:hypothetical protein
MRRLDIELYAMVIGTVIAMGAFAHSLWIISHRACG